ncbi:hypothetical protein ACPPVT_02755 [Angustibacter sp. McL0619]|uniref:hypothetical protein n=1 Tax=Angustibacter sp. McL0619 TaxID=3415676 RepID=UPI003CE8F3D4
MTLVNDIRKTVTDTTPVLALVGATDLVVEKVRAVRTQASGVQLEIDVKSLQNRAKHVPTQAVSKSIELAGKAEETYSDLAARGEKLVARIREQKATQDLLAQGKVTLSRGKAAVTTVRKAADETRTAAKSTLTIAKREVPTAAPETKKAVKRTTTTAKKRAAATKSATKAATTSARKTAAATAQAATAAADKVGD